jgi:hypothetical protein
MISGRPHLLRELRVSRAHGCAERVGSENSDYFPGEAARRSPSDANLVRQIHSSDRRLGFKICQHQENVNKRQ